jgi:hypothetical protein
MSGRKISDHSFWAGSSANGSVFPVGAKVKNESSAASSGAEMDYEDTTEKIKSQQNMSASKIKGHAQKPLHRN